MAEVVVIFIVNSYAKRLAAPVIIICVSVFSALMLKSAFQIKLLTSAEPQKIMPVVVIDAGHGGEDGGAVVEDVLEKDINLAVSKDAQALFTLLGYEVRMTRETDSALSNEGESVRKRKTNDMKKRLEMYDSDKRNRVISIHQNKFSASSSKGAQIFYSPNNSLSKSMAERIAFSVKSLLQPDNERECKQAEKTIYLMKNARQPAVIIECGFISNKEECQRLLDDTYQKQLAFAITTGFIDFDNQQTGCETNG